MPTSLPLTFPFPSFHLSLINSHSFPSDQYHSSISSLRSLPSSVQAVCLLPQIDTYSSSSSFFFSSTVISVFLHPPAPFSFNPLSSFLTAYCLQSILIHLLRCPLCCHSFNPPPGQYFFSSSVISPFCFTSIKMFGLLLCYILYGSFIITIMSVIRYNILDTSDFDQNV